MSSTRTILFADDDPFYRDIAKSTLCEAGYAVQTADGGREALDRLDTEVIDLLVLDLAMPGMSGFDVLEKIRTNRRNLELPILVITGHDDTDSVVRAFDLGATSFLAKPLNWLLFVQHVKFVLTSARAQHELRNATRMAELMSSVKSRFVATLVSEFQTPLRSAYGFAKLMAEEADGPVGSALYKTWIDDMRSSLEKMSTTHARMLNFGRFLADGIELNEVQFHLDALLSAVEENAREPAARRQIALSTKIEIPSRQQMRGDRALLTQALRAVLDNAVKFSPRGSQVTLSARMAPDGAAHLSIEDASQGLTASEIDAIMGVEQVPARPRAALEGLDQSNGLKLARVLIEAHQGAFTLKSIAGAGLSVEVRLPPHRLSAGASESAQARLQALAKALSARPERPRAAPFAGPGQPARRQA